MESVIDHRLVNSRAGDGRERDEGAVWKVAPVPEVNSCGVAVVRDKPAMFDPDMGQGVVVCVNRGERTARRLTLNAQRSLRGGRTCQREPAQTRVP